MSSIAEHVRRRAAARDDVAIRFEGSTLTWGEVVDGVAARAAYLRYHLTPGEPPHVGVLFDNIPEFPMWLCAAAMVEAVVVGINPTRRGAELARDVTHTDCQMIVTEGRHVHLLDGLDLGGAGNHVLDVDTQLYRDALGPFEGTGLPDEPVDPAALYLLLFTSGTSGARPLPACK